MSQNVRANAFSEILPSELFSCITEYIDYDTLVKLMDVDSITKTEVREALKHRGEYTYFIPPSF